MILARLSTKHSLTDYSVDAMIVAFRELFREQKNPSHLIVSWSTTTQLVLAYDASPSDVGAVLSHLFENGLDKPIAFASHSLAPPEKKYSQLDKEALAIIF